MPTLPRVTTEIRVHRAPEAASGPAAAAKLRWSQWGCGAALLLGSLLALGCGSSGSPQTFIPLDTGGAGDAVGDGDGGESTGDVGADTFTDGTAGPDAGDTAAEGGQDSEGGGEGGEDSAEGGADAEADANITPGEPCDDNIPCTVGETRQPNGGCGGGKFLCGDCPGAPCVTNADCNDYEDDNDCNGRLKCAEDRCVVDQDTVVKCSGLPVSPTEVRRCDPLLGTCANVKLPEGATCDDGDACTARDRITNGNCLGFEICEPCDGKANGAACDDADPCTSNTQCSSGRCLGELTCECEVNADCADKEDASLCNGVLRCVDNVCVEAPETIVHCKRACPTSSCFTGVCVASKGQCTGELKDECAP